MSDAPERIVPSCVEALESYQQADMEGVMVLASRQAIHETIDAYWARVKTCEELEAKLAKVVGHLEKLDRLTARDAALVQATLAELKGQDDEW